MRISIKKKIRTAVAVSFYRLFFLIVGCTCRKREYGLEHLSGLKSEDKNWIYCTWHNNVSTGVWVLRGQKLAMMVSESADGEKIARVIRSYGNMAVRGSTSKGSIRVLLNTLKWLRRGYCAAITPDGPRGPKYKVQGGTISLAKNSGCPLVPLCIEADRQWVFAKSWDGHKLPKPFSKIAVRYGRPFYVPKNMDREEFEKIRRAFEKILLEETRRLNRDIRGRIHSPSAR